MRFLQVVRMSEDGQGPSWARSRRRRRSSAGPLIGFLVTLLALFGALTAVMAIKERSIGAGGEVIDGWIQQGISVVKESIGQAPTQVEDAVAVTSDKADEAGATVQAGAEKAKEGLTLQ